MIATVGVEDAISSIRMQMNGKSNPCSIYLHIPLCQKKCDYCHFYVIPNRQSYQNLITEGIKLEWELRAHFTEHLDICSIYFGGGTPALIGPNHVYEILSKIPHKNCEITLEVNPEDASLELMREYKSAGINRVSIGVQSLEDSELQLLSRRHNAKKAVKAVEEAYTAQFKNISIDLMYDIPGQTAGSWQNTLEKLATLPIQHISLYNLTIEPHTVFFKIKNQIQKNLPSPEESLSMYQMAVDRLTAFGFHQYEISAFCKTQRSIHNAGYWSNREFLGLGPSAYSYWNKQRFRNVPNINRWYHSVVNGLLPVDDFESLPADAHERERLVLRLRLLEGAQLSEFHLDPQTERTIDTLIENQLLEKKDGILKLTKKGVIFYDTVAIELI